MSIDLGRQKPKKLPSDTSVTVRFLDQSNARCEQIILWITLLTKQLQNSALRGVNFVAHGSRFSPPRDLTTRSGSNGNEGE